MSIAIYSFLIFFVNKVGFKYIKYSSIDTKSDISFLISIAFMIINYISKLAKLINFSYLA